MANSSAAGFNLGQAFTRGGHAWTPELPGPGLPSSIGAFPETPAQGTPWVEASGIADSFSAAQHAIAGHALGCQAALTGSPDVVAGEKTPVEALVLRAKAWEPE